ncbi:hypothetical protein [Peteryoungia ipomoeae]|uniref:Uncharacterized protein n=1 Tax=Peteryoungia ipomoeae TaxID=1210932 RepID=A0A4S8P314_9HYPH|nr:hypothetical protein [Peteryoungia ipomoeae]THV23665.1 hypothetical protein FAA97_06650 [Peteryoungia ipomoeae]
MATTSCATSRGDRVTRIGSAFGLQDYAITDSYLRAHGMVVGTPAWNVATNLPHYMGAIGGIPIFVPARQAERAIKLLEAVAAAPDSAGRRRSSTYHVTIALLCIVLTGFGAAPPSSGLVVNRRDHTSGRPHEMP